MLSIANKLGVSRTTLWRMSKKQKERKGKAGIYMNSYVFSFREIDKTKLSMVGGKGANLGELSKVQGIMVPEGFCVTTEVYKKIAENNKEVNMVCRQLWEWRMPLN